MDATIDNLERALVQFYHSGSGQQAEAHKWLTQVQLSPDAWPVIWQLLQPNRSAEAQFFGATTLHLKLMKSWSEVPSDQYASLKNKLLETILQYSAGPKLILNRLCIAVSDTTRHLTHFRTQTIQRLYL
ncbi:hypothetical protein AAG570_005188 [Ranatra chinensis]|uniref:Importin N-terminal domain-containing protein n=1 Tax=Ranatra chinensis TaxID=642074 RepID=A0ABD0XZS8_9HEMI